jgi:hypothetical protein
LIHPTVLADDAPAGETTGFVQPPTIDADAALRGVLPHLIHPTVLADDATDDPAIQRTVYDVTVVFRATARLGPPRLQYYVVPADISVPISGGANDSTKACDGSGVFTFFHGLLMGAILTIIGLCILGACLDDEMFSRDGATPKNPEVVLDEAAGAGRRQGPRRLVT